MLDVGVNASSGQLSPGIWMNKCHVSERYPTGNELAHDKPSHCLR